LEIFWLTENAIVIANGETGGPVEGPVACDLIPRRAASASKVLDVSALSGHGQATHNHHNNEDGVP
jgi:hypothetical protein